MKSKSGKPKTFLISDTFFGRTQIIDIAGRPFDTVEEMDEALISNWNNVVSDIDTVYHLGNFAWTPVIADDILKRINGNIKFILGDYDDALLEIADYYEGIEIIDKGIVKDYNHKIILSHYPLLDWPGKEKGIYSFHGHSLKSNRTDLTVSNRVNVAADLNNFIPQNLEVMMEVFQTFKDDYKAKA